MHVQMTAVRFGDNSDLFMKLSDDIQPCYVKLASYTKFRVVVTSL
jgi:hypothetical protein